MNPDIALIWSWLNILTKKRYDQLLEVFGNLEEALQHLDEELLRKLSCREDTMYKILNRLEEFDVGMYKKELQKRNLEFLSIEDEAYPHMLHQIGDPPVFLYYRGDLSILNQPCIGLVGTREISSYGKRVTEAFVPDFVRSGMVTVSGLALGIDAQVARSTMETSGKTVGVLGHGLGQMYPSSHRKLVDDIVNAGGLILSEYPLDQQPGKFTFPARNRIIAGLSLGTVVLEAGEGSGAIITAELAQEYSRDVFAVPGQIFDKNYIGCHQLIARSGAQLVVSAQEVLQTIGVVHRTADAQQTLFVAENDQEQVVYGVLTTMPQSVSDIADRSQLDTGSINATLTMMELRGAVQNTGGGMWVRV